MAVVFPFAPLTIRLPLSAMARPLRSVLLAGVSALALVGLLGLARWLWGRRRRGGSVPGELPTTAVTTDAAGTVGVERSATKKLRPNAEEFYPTRGTANTLVPTEPSGKGHSAKNDVAKTPLTLPPHALVLKGNVGSNEQTGKGVGAQQFQSAPDLDNQSQALEPPPNSGSGARGPDSIRHHPMELLGLAAAVPLSCSQGTSSSGFSEPPLKADDSGILVQGRKYPLASSDVHSETFSEVESFGSAEEISSRQLPVHEESSVVHSLLLGEKSSSHDLIGKPVIKASSSIPGSMSAPSLPVSRLQHASPPQASLSVSSRDLESPLLRLDSFKNRIKVTIQLPRDSVGRFIGKQGRNIKMLMAESNTHVYVNQKNLPKEAVTVPCHIQGSASEVETALKQISIKFPEIDIPSSIDDISTVNTTPLGSLSPLFANIEEGINWNVQLHPLPLPETSPFYAMVSYIECLNRLWVFPYNSSRKLDDLHQSMSFFYSYASSMGLPQVKEGDGGMVGRFCAAKVSNIHWLRGHVTKIGDNGKSYELQLVDYGSSVVLPPASIKPLR